MNSGKLKTRLWEGLSNETDKIELKKNALWETEKIALWENLSYETEKKAVWEGLSNETEKKLNWKIVGRLEYFLWLLSYPFFHSTFAIYIIKCTHRSKAPHLPASGMGLTKWSSKWIQHIQDSTHRPIWYKYIHCIPQ